MLKSLFKISLRRLFKNKYYSFVNLFGLSLGFASVLIIFLFVRKEQSFDSFHDNGEYIFRLLKASENKNGNERSSRISNAIVPFISDVIPSIKYATRYRTNGSSTYADSLTFNNQEVKITSLITDNDFFKVFTFELLYGEYPDFEANPKSAVITKTKAEAIFGDYTSAIGESIIRGRNKFEIVGVLKDIPLESSIKFDIVYSLIEANSAFPQMLTRWNIMGSNSAVRFEKGTTKEQQEKLVASIGKEYHLQVPNSENVSFELQALKQLHFDIAVDDGISNKIAPVHLAIFSAIAIIILIASVVNYCALTLAQSVERVKEIGVRRTVGAKRFQLLTNFFSESILLTSFAFILGLIISELLIPQLEDLLNRELGIHLFSEPRILVLAYLVVIGIALISVIYPALVVSKKSLADLRNFSPASLFNKAVFIDLVNGFQVAVFLFLIASTLYVNKQFSFIQNENLGFNKENVLIVDVNTRESILKKDVLKDEFEKSSYIQSLSFAMGYPSFNGMTHLSEKYNVSYLDYQIEPEYFDVFGLKLLEGRLFDNFEHSEDYVVVNETMAKRIEEGTVLGKKLGNREIIGVVKDFHTQSKREPIRPLALRPFDNDGFGRLAIKLNGSDSKAALDDLYAIYEDVTGSPKFNYAFLDEQYGRIYGSEMIVLKVMGVFTSMALFITILGLLGTTSYSVKRRIKEISIRKILGANLLELNRAVNSKTLFITLIGACVALPLSYLWISDWLNDFAYHIETSISGYILILLLSVILIIPAMTLQTLKVYNSKTVDYLKEE